MIIQNAGENVRSVMVEIQIEVPHHGNVRLGPCHRIWLEGIHADIDVAPAGVLEFQPGLISRCGQLRGGDEALNEIVSLLVFDHYREPVHRLEIVVDIFPGGDESRPLHSASVLLDEP